MLTAHGSRHHLDYCVTPLPSEPWILDINAGNEHTSKHFAPGLWALLDRVPRDSWPAMVRGDAGFGVEAIMRELEARDLPYLFQLRLTANVKRTVERRRNTIVSLTMAPC
jgi:hypothetical protein